MIKNKVLVVLGPTAVGKTALGIELAQQFNGEIISGDSQQVYRGLDIGTAKATPEEQAAAVHHLLDVRDLDENFSAHDFVTAANQLIAEVLEKGKLPIIVGGTGLYIQALVEGYHLGGQTHHQAMMSLRDSLSALTDEEIFQKLADKGIHIHELNRRRAVRALELAEFGDTKENASSPYEFCLIGLNADREILYQRINKRVDQMMTQGLLEEAQLLYREHPTAQAAKGIGYKEFFPYFSGEMELGEAIELVKRNSRRYAKRQLTWFRNRMDVEFFDVFDQDSHEKINLKVKEFLKKS